MKKNLEKLGFKNVGKYAIQNEKPMVFQDQLPKGKFQLVYVFEVNDSLKYVGLTRRGYKRPFFYLDAKKMLAVRNGILSQLSNGHTVNIWVKEFNDSFHYDGLELNLADSYEKALIAKYLPDWNKDKPRKANG
jgi:hypothetical protein